MKNLTKNKENVIEMLEDILKRQIEKVEFENIEEFNSITEYNFSILKANVFYKNGNKEKLYLKMIKGGKIKESIFCYWSLLYEEYLREKQSRKGESVQKAIITQVTSDDSSCCIVLTLNSELNYYSEINLIELKKFYKENLKHERWVDSLEIKNDDILFIGRKMY